MAFWRRAWEEVRRDKGIQQALGRYLRVSDNELPALYLLASKTNAEKPMDLADAWKKHEKGMEEYGKMKEAVGGMSEFKKLPAPGYSLLDLKWWIADKLTESCVFCERRCKKNRKRGELGWCRVRYDSRVSSAFEHWGEEDELVPSGTIFFSGCNWRCVYCQNWNISQYPEAGEAWLAARLAEWVEGERKAGLIRNVNWVGGEPTPNLHNIIAALNGLAARGTNIPSIWNSNMFLSEEAVRLLDGTTDVFLADYRYGNNECAMKFSSVPKYWKTACRNFLLAKKQSELLIRILVMPGHVECCAKKIIEWIAKNLGNDVRTNIMAQYRPEYEAFKHPPLDRRLRPEEYWAVVDRAEKLGLWNIEVQGI